MFYWNKEREIDLCKRKREGREIDLCKRKREGREKIYLDKTEK